MPTELELIALETEFDLYLSFTKRLVLNLPDPGDRTRAAIWLQKLRSIDSDDSKKLRNEHLKLLLFALHRRSLLSVFAKPPPDELESFHDGHTLMEMTRELIEMTEQKLGSGDNSKECPLPPVFTNVSADLKEYCASQSIPKFGAHVYYAISNEPIQMWRKSANCVYPDQHDVPNPLQWELTLSKLTDNVLEKQAEAEHLAAEAAKDDKTEEKDDTQVLPKIDVPVCPGQQPFKWKPDSILTLHQNYNFSDVGVAEDLEEQGKFQLELDEMAFGILDHSLPGRQRVVIRDPYYIGLPSDLAERRLHGVIDEVEEESSSSSSSEMESIIEVNGNQDITATSTKAISNGLYVGNHKTSGLNDKTSSCPQLKNKYRVRKSGINDRNSTRPQLRNIAKNKPPARCKCCGKQKNANLNMTARSAVNQTSTATLKNVGPIARKYLSPKNNFRFGIHFVKETGEYQVGSLPLIINGDDIAIQFEGEVVMYRGTEGVWRLLTQDMSYFNEDFSFSDEDWAVYMEILMRSNKEVMMMGKETFVEEFSAHTEGEWKDYEDEEDAIKIESFWGFGKIGKTLGVSVPDPRSVMQNPFGNISMADVRLATDCVYMKKSDELIRRFANVQTQEKTEDVMTTRVYTAISILEYIFAIIGNGTSGWLKFINWCLFNEPLLAISRFLHYITDELEFEVHIPGTQFCGPGTKTLERIAKGQVGLHPTDAACKEHDLFYLSNKDKDARLESDIKLGLIALERLLSSDASFSERFASFVVIKGMSMKIMLEHAIKFMRKYMM